MRIEANLDDVKEKSNLPGGMYRAVIRGNPVLKQSSTGKDMFVFQLEIIDLDPELKSTCWTQLKHYVVKSDTDGWQTFGMKQIAQAFAVSYDENGFDTDDFSGQEGEVVLEQELYKGKPQTKIAQFVVPTT